MRAESAAPLCATVEAACRQWAPRPAVTFHEATWTYGELWQRVQALAAFYRRLGVGRGDRILCSLRNCPEQLVAMAAAWARGAAHVGCDHDLTGGDLARLACRLDAAALLFQPRPHTGGDQAGDADPLAPLDPVVAARPDLPVVVHGADAGAHHALAGLLAGDGAGEVELAGALEPAMVFLTSGTTGDPKAVVEPRAAHWAKMQFFADALAADAGDVQVLSLPMSHVFGSRLAMLTLLRGGRLVLADRFSPAGVLALTTAEQATVLPAVPAQLQLLADAYDPARHDLSRLRWVISAAANLPRPLAEWVYATLGADMMYVFGCSEGFTMRTTEPADILAGSVGSTVYRGPAGTPPNGAVRIADPADGAPLPAGEVGELCFGADVPVPYWDQPGVAADGWYHTGDLAYRDTHGRVFLVGRLKELINRGGLHVAPAEVETAVAAHPAVADACVVGAPDAVLGEAVCACVVPAAGEPPDLAGLCAFLDGRLARHKLPDELCVVAHIARTELGKVDRPAMRAHLTDSDVARERRRRPAGRPPAG